MFAQVVVNTSLAQEREGPTSGIFTYIVPETLRAILQPGHLVWVPFGSRRLQGIVWALTDAPPPFPTRPIESLARAQPVVTRQQLALARWLSEHYLAPLIDCLRLMLPSGVARRVDILLELASEPPFPTDLTPEQGKLLALLLRSPLTRRRLRKVAPELAKRSLIESLLRRGLIVSGQAVIEAPARPRTIRRARLLVDPADSARALLALGRPSRQADILGWLLDNSDPLPALSDIGVGGDVQSAVHALAERGWVAVNPGRRLLLVPDPTAARAALTTTLARAPIQAAALEALLAAPSPVVEEDFRQRHKVSSETLRALEQRGLVRRVTEPTTVLLAIDREQAYDAIIALRGLDLHRRTLEVLREAGGAAWVGYLYAEAGCDRETLRDLEKAGLVALEAAEVERSPLSAPSAREPRPVLTSDQEAAWETLRAGLRAAWQENPSTPSPTDAAPGPGNPPGDGGQEITLAAPSLPPTYLLHGVTGSGKTELYLLAIEEALAHGRQAIVLVPEIALTPQSAQRFAARFPGRVAVWHSALSHGERFDQWRRIRDGDIGVVVGSRSALFVPLPRLGLIILDEEHEPAYKQESAPRYHAREVAAELGRLAGAPVILGSATPALETYWRARQGQIRLITLSRRVAAHQATGLRLPGALPTQEPAIPGAYADLPRVEVVDLRHELRAGNRSIFSRKLQEALALVLERGQQAILFLNRRGAATFVMCRDCGFVLRCPRCDVPLIYHMTADEDENAGVLICHHCGRQSAPPRTCPQCDSRRIRYFGAGTQKVAEEAARLFPHARIARWDRDTATTRRAHERILAQFVEHKADILVGTQMVAKGLDLPLVTLVGVVAADVGLFLPDFRAAERTFQLLAQVAGRAGRSPLGGRVIVQTYAPEHYAIRAAARHDFVGFYAQEIRFRQEQGYPPFVRLARLIYSDHDFHRAQVETERVVGLLRSRLAAAASQAEGIPDGLIGPAPCFFARQRGRYRWQIIVRSADPSAILSGLDLSPAWRIDIDPISLL